MLLVDHVHIAPAGQQDGPQTALADAVHGVDGHPEAGVLDLLDIHKLQDAVNIFVEGIYLPDYSLGQGLIVVQGADFLRTEQRDLLLDPPGDGLVRVPASGGKDLDAVVNGGVMAGRDGHAIGKLHPPDGEHNQRRGGGAIHHQRLVAVPRQHLRGPVSGLLGQEAPVIPYADRSSAVSLQLHQPAQPGGHQPDVLLGKLIRNDGPPAAGSEFYHCAHLSLLVHPITASTWHTLPAGKTGRTETSRPSIRREATPFSTPFGFVT